MSDRDEKTAIGVPAPTGTDRTMVRAKSTLSDAFSDRTIVYDPNAKPTAPPPPVAEATGGAKQIRPRDTAALEVSEAIAEEATDPGVELVVKKPKKKKVQKPAFNFGRIDKRVLTGIGVGIAAVALVVMFSSPSDETSSRAEEQDVVQEEPQVQEEELASIAAPPPKPAQVITPPPSTDASTAQALEIFDQAVRRTQERASQKVEPYGF